MTEHQHAPGMTCAACESGLSVEETLAKGREESQWPWIVIGVFPDEAKDEYEPNDFFCYTQGLWDQNLPELWCSAFSVEGIGADLKLITRVLNSLGMMLVNGEFPWGSEWGFLVPGTDDVLMFKIPGSIFDEPAGTPESRRQFKTYQMDDWAAFIPITWSSPLADG